MNTLLERVGPAAYEHWQTRQINPEYAVKLYAPTAARKIDADLLGRLIYKEKTLGAKRSGRFNRSPIDVEWPAILRENRWAKHRQRIEDARTQALAELASSQGLSQDTDTLNFERPLLISIPNLQIFGLSGSEHHFPTTEAEHCSIVVFAMAVDT